MIDAVQLGNVKLSTMLILAELVNGSVRWWVLVLVWAGWCWFFLEKNTVGWLVWAD